MGGTLPHAIAFTVIGVALSVANDRESQAVDHLRSLPIAQGALLCGRALANLLEALLPIAIMTVCALSTTTPTLNAHSTATAIRTHRFTRTIPRRSREAATYPTGSTSAQVSSLTIHCQPAISGERIDDEGRDRVAGGEAVAEDGVSASRSV